MTEDPGRRSETATSRPGPWRREVYAALDLGTNNCRLMAAVPAEDGFKVVDSFSRIVRLGEGLQESGRLGEAAMQRALDALRICAARLRRLEPYAMRAVATEACRQAANGRSFLARVREETGLPFEIITPREETELALEGCLSLLQRAPRGQDRGLIFDIGGGSTELGWTRLPHPHRPGRQADRGRLLDCHSFPFGVVTLCERFGQRVFDAAGFASMVDQVAGELAGFEARHAISREVARGRVRLVGTSGTLTTLAGVALDLPRYRRALVDGVALDHVAAQTAIEQLRRAGAAGLAAHPCVGPERASYVLPGCAIFAAIHRTWPTAEVVVADRGLRDGMLLRMMTSRRRPIRRARRPAAARPLAPPIPAVAPAPLPA